MNGMTAALRRYADFEGRSSRTEYWLFALFQFLVLFGGMVVSGILSTVFSIADDSGAAASMVSGLVALLIVLALLYFFIPNLSVTVRRLHDTGNSGWLLLLHLIPLGGFVIFVFTLLESAPGKNRYGPNPHEASVTPGTASVFD